ncbi:glycosyl transferase [Carboxylicivirga mesophila]|uniref:Glycosyl transferase n=1 Tax=Carboxylicivirga mesophila TaxID=1166478 RepID=A0ABS5K680_9BACT|nr:glycosyltransferase family protein [Carboxylicivirga mesophila]MBS2210493.1 glycosyl transferase [Carboxylicivirga mesophila]
MKILYAIQGTGNGHISRAFEVIGHLKKYGEVDLLISGTQCDIKLPWKVKYRFHGMSFIFGKKGGVDLKQTFLRFRPYEFIKEVLAIPVHQYDLVLNDFEPVSAWACKLRNVKCVGISHQSAVLHPQAPKPKTSDIVGKAILKHYAPVSTAHGFHFKSIGQTVSTPVIRDDVRWANNRNKGHYTVYLPSYSDDKIIQVLSQFKNNKWHVFSKHTNTEYTADNIDIKPVNKEKFTKSLVSGAGVLCNAGFETPAEALFLGKKLCVIPMKGQYEQHCNAAFLESMGITRLNSFSKELQTIQNWLDTKQPIQIKYPDNLADVIDEIMANNIKAAYPELAVY